MTAEERAEAIINGYVKAFEQVIEYDNSLRAWIIDAIQQAQADARQQALAEAAQVAIDEAYGREENYATVCWIIANYINDLPPMPNGEKP